MAKQITIRCPQEMAVLIVEALQWFVQSHYPYGADECSTAAREALLELVDRFRRELPEAGESRYSARVRAFVCEAIKGYTGILEQDSGQSWAGRRELLIAVCRGQSDGAGYSEAAAMDEQAASPDGIQ